MTAEGFAAQTYSGALQAGENSVVPPIALVVATAFTEVRVELTQVELAQTLGVNQPAISRLERKADMYVSTLANFVKAMGGKLEIRAVFPDGEVRISQFSDLGKRIKATS